MASNLFSFARSEVAKVPTKKKASDKPTFEITGLKKLATLSVMMKSISALYETTEADVKNQMAKYFSHMGDRDEKQPSNFKGIEGDASASCELRKRSSRSVLSDEEVKMLEENNIPYETVVDVQECFVINPAYSQDENLLAKISKALEKVPGLPADFIQLQPSVTRRVVSEETMATVFKNKLAEDFLSVVGTLAIKPTIANSETIDTKIQELLA
jgi:hypothetical protein